MYEITRVTKSDEGMYSCIARNAAGSTEERILLTVDEDNNIGPTRGDIPGGGEDGVSFVGTLLSIPYLKLYQF